MASYTNHRVQPFHIQAVCGISTAKPSYYHIMKEYTIQLKKTTPCSDLVVFVLCRFARLATFAAALSVLNVTTKMASCVKLSMDVYFKDSVDTLQSYHDLMLSMFDVVERQATQATTAAGATSMFRSNGKCWLYFYFSLPASIFCSESLVVFASIHTSGIYTGDVTADDS